ncbi:mannosyl-oligosaccharide 1,2-alpha-mannosidase [Chlorella sorokiniana]|uniref:alpha-1,2-Mannosidase n=1 Tax=Chlorella sorokiniana TaxID=3076 RepID=A0A2P6TQQ2_CHLSO|nr:mannosyl-oligosaccharide 1,2-alpha-mannosidase [Chlorella sorokiniana]|eukprot:PRW56395.1 mannosyl-oligosaccharide 1,2-alpha-mannosidase [Chlorella sorokiniana]
MLGCTAHRQGGASGRVDELHPQNKSSKAGVLGGGGTLSGMGVSMVDALSTLWLMGLHTEFWEARNWLLQHLRFDQPGTVSFFEAVISVVGGLVSASQLSGDAALGTLAADLAQRLLPAFTWAPTGVVNNTVMLPVAVPDAGNGSMPLAEMGSNILALLLGSIDRLTGLEVGMRRSVGPGTDSYYEYLLKYWLMGGKQDERFRRRWEQAVNEALEQLMVHPPGWSFSYLGDLVGTTLDPALDHLRCFFPGSVALGVMSGAVEGHKAQRHLQFAANMTTACFQLYNSTASGLGAEIIGFHSQTGQVVHLNPRYLQRPEVTESIFYMWRATHDRRWRDMGWRMWRAIQAHCRWEGGYSGALNATQVPVESDNVQQSWFLAETLKYFWLLFSPDAALPLRHWVLNTEAHPLRVLREHSGGPATPWRGGAQWRQQLRGRLWGG